VLSSAVAVSDPKYTTSMPCSRSRQVAMRARPTADEALSTSTRMLSCSPGTARAPRSAALLRWRPGGTRHTR